MNKIKEINQKPKVSVCMITYNHEPFVAQAIEGVLMQQTDFDIELIIGEDFSTDNTRKICKEFEKMYPNIIRVLERQENFGMVANFVDTLKNCKGQYIALCEGDDYWTDEKKIQTQIEYLEFNPECILTFHNRYIQTDLEIKKSNLLDFNENKFGMSDAISFAVPTLTAVFRNKISDIPKELLPYLIDYTLFLFLSTYGYFYFHRFIGACYRIHKGGVFSGGSTLSNLTRNVLVRRKSWQYIDRVDKRLLSKEICKKQTLLLREELRNSKYQIAMYSLFQIIFHLIYGRDLSLSKKTIKKLLMKN